VTVSLPPGYVSILEAADVLEQSLFAGLPDRPIVLKHRQAGLAVGDGAARDQPIAEIWNAVDARILGAMAVGGRPRRLVRLDPDLTQQIPFYSTIWQPGLVQIRALSYWHSARRRFNG
jgi:hypothetical protein